MSLNKQKNFQNENFVIKDKPKKEPIYVMTLELEKGNPDKIEIYPDSDPEKLAVYFCKRHNLDYNGLDYLKQKIKNLLNQKTKEKFIYDSSNNPNSIRKYNEDNQNKENIRNNYNEIFKSNNNEDIFKNSKIINGKSRQRIAHSKKEKKYKDNKKENIYNDRLRNKINKIAKIKMNETFNNNNTNTTNSTIIKKYNSFQKNYFKNKEEEKEIIESKIEINNNKTIKNKRNINFERIFSSDSYKYKTKDNICSKISKEYEKGFSFHPKINENFKTDLTFSQRQKFYKNLYNKRKNELNNFYLNNKKDENGNLFFKPNIISRNINTKNNYEEDIFQKNYQIYKKYELNKEKLRKKYKNNFEEDKQSKSTKKLNEKIFQTNKLKAFNNLFNDLDSDQDGIISGINLKINRIPKNILNIIEPLLIELKEDNQTLNKDEFILAMDKLFEDISLIEKREIINKYKNGCRKNKSLDVKNSNNNLQRIYNNKNYYTNNFHLNNNTEKFAINYYNKVRNMFNELSNKRNQKNNNTNKRNKEKFEVNINISKNFNNNISNCTFNNYIKSLN